jgi:hypothetical protein
MADKTADKTFDQRLIEFASKLNRGSAMSGNIMPRLVLGIAKLTLASVFLWYSVELLCELCKWNRWLFWVDAISLFGLLLFCGAVLVIKFVAEWGRPATTSRGIGIGPFLLLVLIPIIIVAVVGQWNQDPHLFEDSDILKVTLAQTRQIISRLWGS